MNTTHSNWVLVIWYRCVSYFLVWREKEAFSYRVFILNDVAISVEFDEFIELDRLDYNMNEIIRQCRRIAKDIF